MLLIVTIPNKMKYFFGWTVVEKRYFRASEIYRVINKRPKVFAGFYYYVKPKVFSEAHFVVSSFFIVEGMKSTIDVEETLIGQADSNTQEAPVIHSILDTKETPANDIDYKVTPTAHGILRTPAIYAYNKLSSVSSGSKKRVRISSPRKIKSISSLPRMSR